MSHGDPIRCLLAHRLGVGLAGLDRFEVDPASVSEVLLGDWGSKVVSLNERPPA